MNGRFDLPRRAPISQSRATLQRSSTMSFPQASNKPKPTQLRQQVLIMLRMQQQPLPPETLLSIRTSIFRIESFSLC